MARGSGLVKILAGAAAVAGAAWAFDQYAQKKHQDSLQQYYIRILGY